jgi:glycosyltransferase involved in cell wall biosynthesis
MLLSQRFPLLHGATRVARRLKRLVAASRDHLADHGVSATGRKILAWSWKRASRRFYPRLATPPPGCFEIAATFDPATMRACDTWRRRRVVVQEIPVHFDELHSIEVMLATFARPNWNTTRFALVGPDAEELASSRLFSLWVRDSTFVRVALANPIDVSRFERLFLVVESQDGRERNAITAWTSKRGRGRLWVIDRSWRPSAAALSDLGQESALGSLVYRLTCRNRRSELRYRWPSEPRPLDSAGLCVLGGFGGPSRSGCRVVATPEDAVEAIRAADFNVLLIDRAPWSESLGKTILEASERGIASVYRTGESDCAILFYEATNQDMVRASDQANRVAALRRKAMVLCDIVLAADSGAAALARADRKIVVDAWSVPAHGLAQVLAEKYLRLRLPRVSIVTILYNKARELPAVLASYARQSYPGEIELVCVDDCSRDDSVQIAQAFAGRQAVDERKLDLRLVQNEVNSGNCFSRNRGIANATGDLLIVVDADCMLNRDFIRRHVDAHAFGDCEIVIGPHNIETGEDEPQAVLRRFEADPLLAVDCADLQDRVQRSSFLNCITRNFSIKRSALPEGEPLFDPAFTYSEDPASGFGWEDVEMGYRLYKAGARIKFVDEAFSIHISAPAAPVNDRPARSLRNFRRLLEKHRGLAAVTPTWARSTFNRIVEWAERWSVHVDESRVAVEALIAELPQPAPAIVIRSGRPRLRVLTYRWHIAHQYELWKLPLDVTMVTGTGCSMADHWDYAQRPLPPNARFRRLDEIKAEDYDLAILHFDENVLAPENCNGVIGSEWGAAFKLFRDQFNLPKIAICHGTPQFHGQYDITYSGADLLQPIELERQRLVDYLDNVHVVCNSYQAQAEWQFKRSSVIWHGFDPVEFPPATYERGILSPLGPLVLSRPHYRGYFLYRAVFDGHFAELRPEQLHVPEPHPLYVENAYAAAKFRRYVDEIRRYSVYFNPTLRSPMPRARCEPMMCGVVTVSARNHDVDRFIENGVDGFFATEAGELRDQLRFLMADKERGRRIGAMARRKAIAMFHVERYLSDWRRLISSVVH